MIKVVQKPYASVDGQCDFYEPSRGQVIPTESHIQVNVVNWESKQELYFSDDSLSSFEPKGSPCDSSGFPTPNSIFNSIRTISDEIFQCVSKIELQQDTADNSLQKLNDLAKYLESQVNSISTASIDPFMFPPTICSDNVCYSSPNCFTEEYPALEDFTSSSPSQSVNISRTTVSQKEKKREQRLKRVVKKLKLNPLLHCQSCGTKNTPEWRKGPNGRNTLCNACGIRYSKEKRQKRLELGP